MVVPRVGIGRRDDALDPVVPGRLIGRERLALRQPVEPVRQHPCVLERQVGTLRQERQGRMRGVADDHAAVIVPARGNGVAEEAPKVNLFDFADPSLMAGKREVTTVPSQALYLMNSDFALKSGEEMARYLREDLKLSRQKLGYTAYLLAFSRPPTAEEVEKTRAYFKTFVETAKQNGKSPAEAAELSLATFCQALLSSAEFRYLN